MAPLDQMFVYIARIIIYIKKRFRPQLPLKLCIYLFACKSSWVAFKGMQSSSGSFVVNVHHPIHCLGNQCLYLPTYLFSNAIKMPQNKMLFYIRRRTLFNMGHVVGRSYEVQMSF